MKSLPLSNVRSTAWFKIQPFLIFAVLAFRPLFLKTYYLALLTACSAGSVWPSSWHFFSGTTKYVSLGSAAFFGVGVYNHGDNSAAPCLSPPCWCWPPPSTSSSRCWLAW